MFLFYNNASGWWYFHYYNVYTYSHLADSSNKKHITIKNLPGSCLQAGYRQANGILFLFLKGLAEGLHAFFVFLSYLSPGRSYIRISW